MNIKKIAQSLHPLERKVIFYLDKISNFEELARKTGLQEVEIMRALQWLSNKGIIKLHYEENDVIKLGSNGENYIKNGLPERRFLELIKNKPSAISEIIKSNKINKDEINICLGILKQKLAIDIKKDKEITIALTQKGRELLPKETLEEKFLKKNFPLNYEKLLPEEKFAAESLLKRKDILLKQKIKTVQFPLTDLGKEFIKLKLTEEKLLDRLTSSMLKEGFWKNKKFRSYDISINVPMIYGGKKHYVSQAIEYIRRIWLELGFTEMNGGIVQTSFWDLDALFVPQDHPARQMQDTFYIKEPKYGKLPSIWKKIKEVHENGSDTGSKGWRNKWSEEAAKENLLRTHTTVLSAQTIAKLKKSDLSAKFFAVGKVFRNEALDYKHLFEFEQVEGIVVDEEANFTHLKGYLREFFTKMGYLDVRIRPGHFPYTEPSAEIEVLHPIHKEWIELGGSGIFRPEVTKPLMGFECPVLAWGLGLGRIISDYWQIKDIRELCKNDLKQLREIKYWMK